MALAAGAATVSSTPYLDHMRHNEFPGHAPFLAKKTRVGVLSPYAAKLFSQFLAWLCSIVVFGAAADYARFTKDERNVNCNALCGYVIGASIFSFLVLSFMLVVNYLAESGGQMRKTWFSHRLEVQYMILLLIWWLPCVAANSLVDMPTTRTGVAFGWLALFTTLAACVKAFEIVADEEKMLADAAEAEAALNGHIPPDAGGDFVGGPEDAAAAAAENPAEFSQGGAAPVFVPVGADGDNIPPEHPKAD